MGTERGLLLALLLVLLAAIGAWRDLGHFDGARVAMSGRRAELLALIVRRSIQDNILLQDFQSIEGMLKDLVAEGYCVHYYYFDREDSCFFSDREEYDLEKMKDPLTLRGKKAGRLWQESFTDDQGQELLAAVVPVVIGGQHYGTLRFDFREPGSESPLRVVFPWAFAAATVLAAAFLWRRRSSGSAVEDEGLLTLAEGVEALERGDYRLTEPPAEEGRNLRRLSRGLLRLAESLRAKDKIHRYLSSSTLYRLHQDGEGEPAMGGERRRVTIFFTDVRDFSRLSEGMSAQETLSTLNAYLELITQVVLNHGGVVERFIGDSILSVFYAQEAVDGAHKAVLAAMALDGERRRFDEQRRRDGEAVMALRVGIATGKVITGNIGSRERSDYMVIGEAVKLAASIEKEAHRAEGTNVLCDGETEALVRGFVKTKPHVGVELRGIAEARTLFEIEGIQNGEDMLEELADADEERALKIVEILGNGREPAWIEGLLPSLDSDSVAIRVAVLRALGKLAAVGRSEEIAQILLRRLPGEPSARVRATLVAELAVVAGPDAAEIVAQRLDDKDPRVRANAVTALERLCTPEDLAERIEPHLQDHNHRVKANVAMALWRLGRPRVLQLLRQMLFDPEEDVRAGAIHSIGEIGRLPRRQTALDALGRSGDPDELPRLVRNLSATVDHLIEALDDECPRVRQQAVIALGKLGDRKAVDPLLDSLGRADSLMLEGIGDALERLGVQDTVLRLVRSHRPREGKA